MFKMSTSISSSALLTFCIVANGTAAQAVSVTPRVLQCAWFCSEHPTGKSVMVLGRVSLVDTPHIPRFPLALKNPHMLLKR
jgi:hypothetical protein